MNKGTADDWRKGEALSTLESQASVKTYHQESPTQKYTSGTGLYRKVLSKKSSQNLLSIRGPALKDITGKKPPGISILFGARDRVADYIFVSPSHSLSPFDFARVPWESDGAAWLSGCSNESARVSSGRGQPPLRFGDDLQQPWLFLAWDGNLFPFWILFIPMTR